MSKQTITTLSLGAVLLVLFGVMGWRYYSNFQLQQATNSGKYLFTQLDVTAITGLTITTKDYTTTLAKQADQWMITSADPNSVADATKLTALLEALSHMRIQSTVSVTPTNLADYQLDTTQVVHVTAQTGTTTVAEINLGKNGAAPQTVLVQRGSEPTVYLVTGQRSVFTPTDWSKPADTVTNTTFDQAESSL